MAERSAKEKQQIIILSTLFGVILLVIAYTQRASFLPSVVQEGDLGPETRASITIKATDQLFEDTRFTSLENHIDAPLKPATTGNAGLFVVTSP